MAKEWNDGMALGVLVIVFGGPGLFIPAVLMGDWMAEARNAEETWLPAWVLPKVRSGGQRHPWHRFQVEFKWI